MKEKRTQKEDIKKYIETHKKGITSIEAINMFGATRLSGIIFDLRKSGMNIVTKMKSVDNRYGGKSQIAVYKLGD